MAAYKGKYVKIILITFALLALTGFIYLKITHFFEIDSCLDKGGSWNYEKKLCEIDSNNSTIVNTGKDKGFSIDTFSIFPPEIDGCSCLFSNDSNEYNNGKFIYMNDLAQTAFLKVNGVLVKFIQIDFKEINSLKTIAKYISDEYEMSIEVISGSNNDIKNGINTGTIKLINKKGETISKKFYGECGY